MQLPVDTSQPPTAFAYDEYGTPEGDTNITRYGWLGGKERSSETGTGATLMGVRLYDPTTGRFLSVDPVPGGSADAYEYCGGDPINRYDLDGRFWGFHLSSGARLALHYGSRAHGGYLKWRNRQQARIVGIGMAYIGPNIRATDATTATVCGSAPAAVVSTFAAEPRSAPHTSLRTGATSLRGGCATRGATSGSGCGTDDTSA